MRDHRAETSVLLCSQEKFRDPRQREEIYPAEEREERRRGPSEHLRPAWYVIVELDPTIQNFFLTTPSPQPILSAGGIEYFFINPMKKVAKRKEVTNEDLAWSIEAQGKKLDGVSNTVGTLVHTVSDLAGSMGGLEQKAETLSQKNEDLAHKIDGVAHTVNDLARMTAEGFAQTASKTNLHAVEGRLTIVEAKLDRALYSEYANLEHRVTRLEKKTGVLE